MPVGGRRQVHSRRRSRTGLDRGELAGGGIEIEYLSRRVVSEHAEVETRSERHRLAGVLGNPHAENVAGVGLKLVSVELQPRAGRLRWADWRGRGRADLLIHRRNAAVQRHNAAGRIRRRAVPLQAGVDQQEIPGDLVIAVNRDRVIALAIAGKIVLSTEGDADGARAGTWTSADSPGSNWEPNSVRRLMGCGKPG